MEAAETSVALYCKCTAFNGWKDTLKFYKYIVYTVYIVKISRNACEQLQ